MFCTFAAVHCCIISISRHPVIVSCDITFVVVPQVFGVQASRHRVHVSSVQRGRLVSWRSISFVLYNYQSFFVAHRCWCAEIFLCCRKSDSCSLDIVQRHKWNKNNTKLEKKLTATRRWQVFAVYWFRSYRDHKTVLLRKCIFGTVFCDLDL